MRSLLSVLLLAACGPVCAADLAKIDRTIKAEPKYSGQPRYCLLVIGSDAKHRVWIVQDGDTLYVDRNGNGDLTEPWLYLIGDDGIILDRWSSMWSEADVEAALEDLPRMAN